MLTCSSGMEHLTRFHYLMITFARLLSLNLRFRATQNINKLLISTFIKDYFGDTVSGTNACRIMAFSVAQLMDHVTDNNDWNIYKDPKASLR